MLDLEPIKKREAEATPGPWVFDSMGDWGIRTPTQENGIQQIIVMSGRDFRDVVIEEDTIGTAEDGEFLAAAREDVPALVAEVEDLRDALRLCLGMHLGVPWDAVPDREVAGYLNRIRELKTE